MSYGGNSKPTFTRVLHVLGDIQYLGLTFIGGFQFVHKGQAHIDVSKPDAID